MRSQVNISQDVMQSLTSCLEELCSAVDAQQALLFNPMGQTLISHGGTEGPDLSLMVPLIANGIAAIREASSLIEQSVGSSLYYHAGSNFDLYGASVHENLMILLRLDRQQDRRPIGAVWFYLQQAIKSMRSIFPESSQEKSVDSDDPKTRNQREPVMEGSGAQEFKELTKSASESATEPGHNREAAATKPGHLLSYSEAETQGLISSES
jgi:hypothetical protein